MKIMDILVKDAVILDLGGRRSADVLSEMAARSPTRAPELDRGRCSRCCSSAKRSRARASATASRFPHGKLPGLSRLVASFARSPEGVDFDSIDGQKHPSLLPAGRARALRRATHLKALARISRFFRDRLVPQARSRRPRPLDDVLPGNRGGDAKL